MVKYGKFFRFNHKFWEIQIEKWDETINYINFHVELTRKTDHAGFRFTFEICGYFLAFNIYDSRHWDEKTNNWRISSEN